MKHICILCNKEYFWKDNSFVESENKTENNNLKYKYFCCNECKETENGKKYFEMKMIKNKILAISSYILFSILGIVIYILLIVSFA